MFLMHVFLCALSFYEHLYLCISVAPLTLSLLAPWGSCHWSLHQQPSAEHIVLLLLTSISISIPVQMFIQALNQVFLNSRKNQSIKCDKEILLSGSSIFSQLVSSFIPKLLTFGVNLIFLLHLRPSWRGWPSFYPDTFISFKVCAEVLSISIIWGWLISDLNLQAL